MLEPAWNAHYTNTDLYHYPEILTLSLALFE